MESHFRPVFRWESSFDVDALSPGKFQIVAPGVVSKDGITLQYVCTYILIGHDVCRFLFSGKHAIGH